MKYTSNNKTIHKCFTITIPKFNCMHILTTTLSNSSSNDSNNEYTSLKYNYDALVAKYCYKKVLARFNKQLKV